MSTPAKRLAVLLAAVGNGRTLAGVRDLTSAPTISRGIRLGLIVPDGPAWLKFTPAGLAVYQALAHVATSRGSK